MSLLGPRPVGWSGPWRQLIWGGLLAVAVLWPSRLAGPFDGAPLDGPLEAVALGLVLPAIVTVHGAGLRRNRIRVLIVALLAWKLISAALLVQDGWCVKFTSPTPLFLSQETVPHSWDVRADWRSEEPRCSAVMTKGYRELGEFPVWFYNLPPPTLALAAVPAERPPYVSLRLDVNGYIQTDAPGTLAIAVGRDVALTVSIDGALRSPSEIGNGLPLAAGLHEVRVEGELTRSDWAFVPTWNGESLWAATVATMAAPTPADLMLRPLGRWLESAMVGLLLLAITFEFLRDSWSLTTIVCSACLTGLAIGSVVTGRDALIRGAPLLLLTGALIPVAPRCRNLRGAFLLIGVPFLAMLAAIGAPTAGFFTWYSSGDDWWMFQRFAYRIFMEGYWLEGGQPTFWFQPLYRWIAGALHMVFGDSSLGELFWDAGCALTGALFAFHVTRVMTGFRWGLIAGAVTLALMTIGPAWYLFGRGLSEITSAGFVYASALLALRGRRGSVAFIALAGVCAILGFYARMNNLAMVFALAAFSLPVRFPAALWQRHSVWWPRVSKPALAGLLGGIAVGLWLLIARTYYYTGAINFLQGTQAGSLTVWQTTDDGKTPLQNVVSSLLMVLTMNDPPRADVRALPLVLGSVLALGALARLGVCRRLPLNVVGLCLGGLLGALVARGTAYPGRFSVHLIPAATALTVCGVAFMAKRYFLRTTQ